MRSFFAPRQVHRGEGATHYIVRLIKRITILSLGIMQIVRALLSAEGSCGMLNLRAPIPYTKARVPQTPRGAVETSRPSVGHR